jgi:hypothetical protein
VCLRYLEVLSCSHSGICLVEPQKKKMYGSTSEKKKSL